MFFEKNTPQAQQRNGERAAIQHGEIANLFPIPLYAKFDAVPDYKVECLREFINLPPHELVDNWGDVSINNYFLNQEKCQDLKNQLLLYVNDMANNVLGFAGEYAITQSWVSTKRPYQSHQLHTHPNSIISGVYYFDNVEDTSSITFVKTNTTTLTYSLKPISNGEHNMYTAEEIHINVKNNMLLLFPSYLQHRVSINETQVNRYSLAFNCMPRYQLGMQNDLTELKMPKFD
jgi:uncharacterized protein (TIGR02466 family)